MSQTPSDTNVKSMANIIKHVKATLNKIKCLQFSATQDYKIKLNFYIYHCNL